MAGVKSMMTITDDMKNQKTYNGNTRKFGITIDGVDYIVKFSKGEDLSVYSEYIASNFIRALDVPCHEVALGTYHQQVVNVIKDFTSGTELALHSFKDTKQSSEDTDLTFKEYTYDDVLYLIDKHLKMSDDHKLAAKKQFWDMLICDAIIGNRDRHWGNWGYLSDREGHYQIAPLYDNGAGLFPDVNKVIGQYTDSAGRKQFLKDRIFVFPASLFKIKRPDRAYRSNFYEMLGDLDFNEILRDRVESFRRRISYSDVFEIVSDLAETTELPDVYKRFYVEIVTMRYMCIILRMDFDEVYERIEGQIWK
jgi:hypothetical protein